MSNALTGFANLIAWVDQLANIHSKLGQNPGRRHNQEALYRAGVVMTMAAWESYVEDLLIEGFTAISPPTGAASGALSTWKLAQISAISAAKKFNTPNAKNVTELFQQHLGIDVASSWAVTASKKTYTSSDSQTRLNNWLDIRHKIAHGGALPTNLAWIKSPTGTPRLTLALMNDARHFTHELAKATDSHVSSQLKSLYGLPTAPW